jgi:predicted O-methyltransferase YrrM
MIDLSTPNEWQHICPDTGLIMPWYTKPALDEIVTWDLKDKVVFEYGCGASSLWWARKSRELYGVEYNFDYFCAVYDNVANGATILHEQNSDSYVESPKQWQRLFDIIIIDGSFRDACVPVALECLKPGGKLIFDNWMQPEVEMQQQETQDIVLALPHAIYKQEGHKFWQTLIATKP